MIETVVFDTKPYDRDHLRPAAAAGCIEWRFLEFRLNRDTAAAAKGAQAALPSGSAPSGGRTTLNRDTVMRMCQVLNEALLEWQKELKRCSLRLRTIR